MSRAARATTGAFRFRSSSGPALPEPEHQTSDEPATRAGCCHDGTAAAALETLLGEVAERIVEHGTATEARVLEAMSVATRQARPGAAAALIDWNGTEVARLRAFGIVHGVVLDELGPCAQSSLVDRILGTDLARAG